MRNINSRGENELKLWEGKAGKPVLHAYLDGGGVPTIGFGHIKGVRLGMTCTPEQALQWLREDLDESEAAVSKAVRVPLNDNQFAALVLFVFNVGVAAFKGSTLLRLLNAGNYDAVPAQLMRWTKDRDPKTGKMVSVRGLVNRRAAEVALWGEPAHVALSTEPLASIETGRRPLPPPSPTSVLQTSTGKAQTTALVAGGTAAASELVKTSFGDSLREGLDQLSGVAWAMESLQFVLVFGTLALVGWTLYDRHRKLKESGQ